VAGFAEFVDSLLPARRGNAEQRRQ
jgi:hypothetical protein